MIGKANRQYNAQVQIPQQLIVHRQGGEDVPMTTKTTARQECMQMGGGGDSKRRRLQMGNKSIINGGGLEDVPMTTKTTTR
jgi:hypothetical protein